MPDSTETSKDRQFIADVKAKLKACIDAESLIRSQCLNDLEFLAGSPDDPARQWGQNAVNDRNRDGRPTLVVNRLDQFVQHITNQQRQNRIAATVFPVDDKGDPDTADVIQGMLRNIGNQSRDFIAFNTAEFYAVAGGFGAFMLITTYANPFTDEQELRIVRINNPFQVYWGPHTEPDACDAEFAFYKTWYTKDEYKAEFGEEGFEGEWEAAVGDQEPDWLTEDGCCVLEYRCKEYKDDVVVRTESGLFLKSELANYDELKNAGVITNERETKIPTVKWYKLSPFKVLDETVLPFLTTGIYKVIGSELNVNGKTILKGIVRNLKDAQRQYNYMLSAQTEAAMDSGDVVMEEGQDEGYEQEWATRKVKKHSVLHVKSKLLEDGSVAKQPIRLPGDATIQAKTEARLMAADDLKALTGIYDAALGAKSNETSGRAIANRQVQSDVANFHFQDNLTIAISSMTKDMVYAVPQVYSGPRAQRITGEDDLEKIVKLNQIFTDKDGRQKIYDLSLGKYDVVCTAGPSWNTKRQQGQELLIQLAGQSPVLMNAAPDLVIKNFDIPYVKEISERLKKTLPPGLAEDENKPQIPPEVMQQMQQQQQQMQALDAFAKQVQQENEAYKAGAQVKQMELDSKERIRAAEMEHERQMEELKQGSALSQTHAKTDSAEAIAAFNGEVQLLLKNIQAQNDMLLAKMGHEAAQAAKEMEGSETAGE